MRVLAFLKAHLPIIGLLYLVAMGFGAWGFAVARYEVFPFAVLQPIAEDVQAFLRGAEGENKTLRERLALHRQERPREARFAYSDITGFQRVDEAFVDSGYVLITRFSNPHGQVIIDLVRLRDFATLHRWIPPLNEILERGPRDKGDNSFDGYRAQHPLLLEGGSVVFTSGEGPLVRIDRDSEIEWVNTRHFHHTIERDVQGNMVVPHVMESPTRELPVQYRDDGYAVVSPDGRILEEHSIVDILMEGGHEGLLMGVGKFEWDRIHLNDAEPVHRGRGVAQVGDVILSIRNLSTVLLYRPATAEVIWLKTGPWLNQHDVNLMKDGRYSVFDNDMIRFRDLFIARDGISNIYIYDPTTDLATAPFTAQLTELNAVTETAGRARILENGDAFAEIHDAAQLVRMSTDTIRWVYVNGQSENTMGLVHWARYYSADEIPDLTWLDTDPAGEDT